MKPGKFILFLLAAVCISSCTKNKQQRSACGTQVCTDIFASLAIRFVDKQGNPIAVSGFSVVDLATNKQFYPAVPTIDYVVGLYTIATDNELKDLSTNGDDLKISGTNRVTGQTKSVIVRVAGGCHCHVSKVSGPDQIQFD